MGMKLNTRNLIGFAILVVAAALIALVARNLTGVSPRSIVETLPSNVDLTLKEINYTETQEGKRRWTLVADSAAHSIGAGITRIENIHMTFFDLEGVGDLTLTARNGELNSETREISVNGDVVVHSPKGYALYTEWLHYREVDRMASTDAPVRLLSDTMEVTGTGMRLDVRKYSVVLLKDVKARLASAGKNAG